MSTILTKEGLQKVKGELKAVQTVNLPKAQQEFDEVRAVWGREDPPYHDASAKLKFYNHRYQYLQRLIDNATWNEEKGFYNTSGEDTQ